LVSPTAFTRTYEYTPDDGNFIGRQTAFIILHPCNIQEPSRAGNFIGGTDHAYARINREPVRIAPEKDFIAVRHVVLNFTSP
jgi:hypothetical protein